MLRPTSTRDLRVELFGKTYDTPLLITPVGVQSLFHADKETGMASVATEIGVPYIMSTASSSTIEEVATASGSGDRWFQLYWPQDDEITSSILNRAKKAGFTVLVVTLDTWALAWRPWDLDHAFVPFFMGTGNQVGFSDPVFRRKFKESHEGKEIEDNITAASESWMQTAWSGAANSWERLEVLKRNWDGPIVLKGVQHLDDARRAVECGMHGIVVSNHGGRQLDGAVGSLDMLPEIVEAVGDKCTVLFDSGVRTGTDVIKALCLGAKGVLIGRPWVYGLGIAGKEGARQVLKGLLADLDQSMGLAGIQSVKDCTEKMVRRIQYPGDRHSSY
jgi:lactate 2-monooxygenase